MSIVLNGTTGITAPDIDVTAQTTVAAFDAGITLGGSATTLDDYEEGTWTPTFVSVSGAFSSATGLDSSTGEYIKIGNLVTLRGFINLNADCTNTEGQIFLGGLPFTQGGLVNYSQGVAQIYQSHGSLQAEVGTCWVNTSNQVQIFKHTSNGAVSDLVYFSLAYEAS